jgi:hypothetical protein
LASAADTTFVAVVALAVVATAPANAHAATTAATSRFSTTIRSFLSEDQDSR